MSGPSRRLTNERPEADKDVTQRTKKGSEVRCKICLQPHVLRLCPRFRAMDSAKRRRTVMKLGFCFNCLAESHKRLNCKSRERCMECCGEHHTMLHPRFVGKRENPPSAVASRPQNSRKATEKAKPRKKTPRRDTHQRRSLDARSNTNAANSMSTNPESHQPRAAGGRCTCGHNPVNTSTVSPNTGSGPATIVIHVHSGSH
ncbi:uncharacterized protein LOC142236334 [Haematobia irritans]|uniref:uncharacterized protein LOC142236334 n=1 Tax=Haematobia irritans TaxID=7368 RepID=UPI003F4F4E4F